MSELKIEHAPLQELGKYSDVGQLGLRILQEWAIKERVCEFLAKWCLDKGDSPSDWDWRDRAMIKIHALWIDDTRVSSKNYVVDSLMERVNDSIRWSDVATWAQKSIQDPVNAELDRRKAEKERLAESGHNDTNA